MARLQKTIDAFKSCDGPFPYKDVVSLLTMLGYEEKSTGGGSRRRFMHPKTKDIVRLHEPHPGSEILPYLVRQIRDHLDERGLI